MNTAEKTSPYFFFHLLLPFVGRPSFCGDRTCPSFFLSFFSNGRLASRRPPTNNKPGGQHKRLQGYIRPAEGGLVLRRSADNIGIGINSNISRGSLVSRPVNKKSTFMGELRLRVFVVDCCCLLLSSLAVEVSSAHHASLGFPNFIKGGGKQSAKPNYGCGYF